MHHRQLRTRWARIEEHPEGYADQQYAGVDPYHLLTEEALLSFVTIAYTSGVIFDARKDLHFQ